MTAAPPIAPGVSLPDLDPADDPAGDGETVRKYRAPALEKGLDILELLASHGAPMTPSQISLHLKRSVSELFRMIQVLEFRGYIAPAATADGYELTNKLFTLGMARAPVRTLLEAALPLMRDLTLAIGQSCHLAVASDDQMVVVARIENPGHLGFSVRPGYHRSLVEATSGMVLYAFQPPPVQAAWRAMLERAVGPDRVASFAERAATVRAQGYEQAASDYVMGVMDLSAPVIGTTGGGTGAAVAALTVPFVQHTPLTRTLPETIGLLQATARQIAHDLTERS
ncbi:IclR family transcriptional regulator [Nitrospirillum iridis]|uniref:DNA-binding IclR family transcriptional regulator n=1 Tax=Nitrospirillum iridis TaxID=765888 RepID=A0A7X0AVL8_9PROT|nr:helix-turn-helix domain-containing protein [Nitrospirillum iridis]MBB6250908.1 DNA-binding IclR family transcriptional regulator [Nitrospirillum iridis]